MQIYMTIPATTLSHGMSRMPFPTLDFPSF